MHSLQNYRLLATTRCCRGFSTPAPTFARTPPLWAIIATRIRQPVAPAPLQVTHKLGREARGRVVLAHEEGSARVLRHRRASRPRRCQGAVQDCLGTPIRR